MTTPHVTRRPARDADRPFVDALLLADAEATLAGLSDPLRTELARAQVLARRAGYAADWPHAQDWVVECDGEDVGRLLLDTSTSRWHLVDLRLAADARRHGTGTALLAELAADADASGATLTLTVGTDSAARPLYERAGFVPAGGPGAPPDIALVRRAPSRTSAGG